MRRHPHVFARDEGEPALDTAGQVRTRWEEIKAQERGAQAEAARRCSAASRRRCRRCCARIRSACAPPSVGFDWTSAGDVVDKIQEEVDEMREVVERPSAIDRAAAEEEMGDLLFAIANLSRKLGIEPETALRKANDKFTRRFEAHGTSDLSRPAGR